MIKYIEFESIDEYGQHITPAFERPGVKLACEYSQEITNFLAAMPRDENLYYVVINALGSYEGWGPNRNGDAFPESGLNHVSLRTDMGTPNDYGYKTFEYYAKLYKHHVNKDPKKSFGDVLFSSWNPRIKRVELVVGIYRDKGASIIDAIENQNTVSVSMGCKVRYDRCSICGNKARARAQYCVHLKSHLRKIVSKETAALWSKELGLTILPGSAVMMFNDHPRFFDISEVYIGAERTSFVLGKTANDSGSPTLSVDVADAYGVTDADIDKLAVIGKEGDIDKKVGGEINVADTDGRVVAVANNMVSKIDASNRALIETEPEIDADKLDFISGKFPLSSIFSTMIGMGMHPKPREFQRIVLVNIGSKDIADALDKNNEIFDYVNACDATPINLPIGDNCFNDGIGKLLAEFVRQRSAHPELLIKRFEPVIEKVGAFAGDPTKNYWLDAGPGTGSVIEQSRISPIAIALGGMAAIYAGLKLKAMGYSPKSIIDIFENKPWLKAIIGGSIYSKLSNNNRVAQQKSDNPLYLPASAYANVLQDTGLTGHMKQASVQNAIGLGLLTSAVVIPGSYVVNSYNQRSIYTKGRQLFPGAGTSPGKAAVIGGLGVAGGVLGYEKAKTMVSEAMKKGLKKVR